MIAGLQKKARNYLFRMRASLQLDRSMILQGNIRAEQILGKGKLPCLSDAGFGVFSQTDEDGILSWLVDRLGVKTRTFVEFGVHDYRESNTRYLLATRNWSGLVIDGDSANIQSILKDEIAIKYDLQAVSAFITRDSIGGLIRAAGFTDRVGILSTDIDGVDYWVLERAGIEADIVVVEYNDFLGDLPVTVPYSPTFSRLAEDPHGVYWGASLAAFRSHLEGRGYVFVGTNILGINAFFVHADHAATIKQWLEDFVAHRCVMREARDSSGSQVNKQYREFTAAVASKPLVRVDTGETVQLGDVCRR